MPGSQQSGGRKVAPHSENKTHGHTPRSIERRERDPDRRARRNTESFNLIGPRGARRGGGHTRARPSRICICHLSLSRLGSSHTRRKEQKYRNHGARARAVRGVDEYT